MIERHDEIEDTFASLVLHLLADTTPGLQVDPTKGELFTCQPDGSEYTCTYIPTYYFTMTMAQVLDEMYENILVQQVRR